MKRKTNNKLYKTLSKLPKNERNKFDDILNHIEKSASIQELRNKVNIKSLENEVPGLYRIRLNEKRIMTFKINNHEVFLDKIIPRQDLGTYKKNCKNRNLDHKTGRKR